MKAASATSGVIAGNELIQAEKQLEAERAKATADKSAVEAARAAVKAIQELEAYLRVTAPFAGVVTTRNVHPGALVGTDIVMFTVLFQREGLLSMSPAGSVHGTASFFR